MTPAETEQILTEAENRHCAGDLDGAERRYNKVLAAFPDNTDAMQLLGSLKLQRGDIQSASDLLNRAVRMAPRNPVARLNLAACFQKSGLPHKALPHAVAATEIAPRSPDTWRQLSFIAERAERKDLAIEGLRRLLELVPQDRGAAVRRATLLLHRKRIKEAEIAIVQLMRSYPPADDISNLLTRLYAERLDWEGMAAAAAAWLKMSPESEMARERLSEAQLEAGNFPGAMETYRPLVTGEAPPPQRRLAYARLCLIAQNFKEAEGQLAQAREELPESAEAAYSWGRLNTFVGNLDEAEAACRQAIELDPEYIYAYTQLSIIRRGRMDDEHVRAMNRLWKATEATDSVRAVLGMSLGDVFDKAGRIDEAFDFYRAANELNHRHFARANSVYEPADQESRTKHLVELFGDMPMPDRTAADGLVPVFIVGMPRSGTTLVESVLAAHSRVYGAGEVLTGGSLLELFLQQMKARPAETAGNVISEYREKWRKTYLESLPPAPNGELIVTDKLPTNFLGLGLLAQLFPEAHFIHTCRNPMDTCWSIFRHPFPRGYHFAHRLEDIGHYYNEYRRVMAFWQKLFGDRLHTVVYEELAANPDVKCRELIEFCGLDWEADCLAFHEKKRAIATFSSVQVRSPISSSSIGAAERYRRHLAPLAEALGGSGQD